MHCIQVSSVLGQRCEIEIVHTDHRVWVDEEPPAGSLLYMSPQLLTDFLRCSEGKDMHHTYDVVAADWWAVGPLLFEAATGHYLMSPDEALAPAHHADFTKTDPSGDIPSSSSASSSDSNFFSTSGAPTNGEVGPPCAQAGPAAKQAVKQAVKEQQAALNQDVSHLLEQCHHWEVPSVLSPRLAAKAVWLRVEA